MKLVQIACLLAPMLTLGQGLVASETSLHFGSQSELSSITKLVTLVNYGADSVIIQDIQSDCSCIGLVLNEGLTYEELPLTVPPEGIAEVWVTLAPAGLTGAVKRRVSAVTTQGTINIEVSATIRPALKLRPQEVAFHLPPGIHRKQLRTVTVSNAHLEPLVLSNFSTVPGMRVLGGSQSLAPGQSTKLTLVLEKGDSHPLAVRVPVRYDLSIVGGKPIRKTLWAAIVPPAAGGDQQ